MKADHILTCHGYCRADREQLLESHPGLADQLEQLPEDYRADDVAAAIQKQTEQKTAKNAKKAS